MIQTLIQGFLVGIAYVAPIGMQNAYVINSATKLSTIKALQVAVITMFFDISLALACFFGVGLLLDRFEFLSKAVMIVGSIGVIYIGIMLFRSKSSGLADSNVKTSMLATIGMCFTVTWLNPQAIIDGTMLLSGFKATLSQTQGYLFITGVALASITWFSSLVLLVSRFKSRLTPNVLTNINRVCGIIIIYFGIRIGLHLFG